MSSRSLLTSTNPISGSGARPTEPPCVRARSCPPKQMPRTGTPAVSASRSSCISGANHEPIISSSHADQYEPMTTSASNSRTSGNSTSTPGFSKSFSGTTWKSVSS